MIEGAPTAVQALLLLAVVLAEAVALYVGYGYVEQLVGSRILDRIAGT